MSKEISRRVSYWHRRTLKERLEFKASAADWCREQVKAGIQLASLSILRLFEQGEPPG
ncbi:MAG: hypothetical protein J2P21_28095 [Chloracidobacterium sp.]|nr:hypothetical protein [Chloracidobacterium sp.]